MKSVTSLLVFRSPSLLGNSQGGFACPTSYRLGRARPTARLTYPSVSPHRSNTYRWYWILNQLSITYAVRLGLGPDLPWADEPSPGILRFSAGEILPHLFAYSYRHSLFQALHQTLQSNFADLGMLPYPSDRFIKPLALRSAPGEHLGILLDLSFALPHRKQNP